MNHTDDPNRRLQHDLAQRDRKIVELNYLLAEREREVAELAEVVAQIEGSLSWRLTAPVRALGQQARRVKAVLCAVRHALAAQGGAGAAARKTVRVLRQEGWDGVKMRIAGVARQVAPMRRSYGGAADSAEMVAGMARSHVGEMRKAVDIAPYDIISLDVFDTALLRLTARPEEVFAYMERHYQLPGFKAKRLEAEQMARAQHTDRKDVDLDLIYAQPPLAGIDSALEMEAELHFSVANPVIYDLYMRARILKKPVWFVSDMYLKHEQVAALLQQAGYTDYEQLVVSSHDDLVKGDGSRFEVLKKQWGEQKALHIGDNRLADYDWPQRLGIDAYHYQEPAAFYQDDPIVGSLYEGLVAQESLGLAYVLGSYRRWKYGDKSTGWSLWRDVGFVFGGPLLLLFSRYLHEQALAQQADRLCFLARDGRIMQQVYQTLYGEEAIDNVYVLASRRAMTFPLFGLESLSPEQKKLLDIYVSIHETADAAEVFERLAYPDYTELLDDLTAQEKGGLIRHSQAVEAVLARHHEGLQTRAHAEREALWQYFDGLGLRDENKHSLLVDVGWVGTIQDSLNALLAAEGHGKQFNGVYLGVLPVAKNTHTKEGFLFDGARQAEYRQWAPLRNFIELLTAAPVPGVVRFEAEQPDGVRYDEALSAQEAQRLAIAKDIQRGIMDFVHCSKQHGPALWETLQADDLIVLFELLQKQPTPALRAMLSHTKHARLPSNAFNHSIIDF